jgi:hypothetical protein
VSYPIVKSSSFSGGNWPEREAGLSCALHVEDKNAEVKTYSLFSWVSVSCVNYGQGQIYLYYWDVV